MKKHLGFIIFFGFLIFLFLGKLLLVQEAFLNGDYLAQHYPWSKIYAESIKQFNFPFWTRYFHSGFPLMAEGQIGGFYPLNIIMFFMLPFNVAYNYSVVLHFILGGVFTYIYSRKLGADQWGGALSALLFCFGSAYAGCSYNTAVVRTLIWFPLVLFLFEKYFESKRPKYIIAAGIVMGLQLLAGYVQIGFYSILLYIGYFIYGLVLRKALKAKDVVTIAIGLCIALIIFYPQFVLSWQLIKFSGRSDSSPGFALWGSFSPISFIGAFFPYLVCWDARFYIGVFSILFLIISIYTIKKEIKLYPILGIFLAALFLAFGKYNPFYVILLKLTKFYSFRNPSKFLLFAAFAASVLTGLGFTHFFTTRDAKYKNKAINTFTLLINCALVFFSMLKIIVVLFKKQIINLGEWYVKNYIFGKEYHRYTLDAYLQKVNNFYKALLESASFANIFIIVSVVLCIGAIFIPKKLLKIKHLTPVYKMFFMTIIFLDIFVFSTYGTGFRGNIKSFDYIAPTHNKILKVLKSDKEIFRIAPFGLTDAHMPQWARPNANIAVGIDSIAAYTPLAMKGYKNELLPLEVVDDSLGLLSSSDEALIEKYRLLQILNVKYVISTRRLGHNFLKEAISDSGIYLYRLEGYLPRAFFTYDIDNNIIAELAEYLKIVEYKDGFIKIKISTGQDGFLVFSENYFPGWLAFVDGVKTRPVLVKNLVQAVKLNKGIHSVIFKYNPAYSLKVEG